MAEHVRGVDEERGLVWFLGTKDGVTERHLYVVPFAGGEPRRVSEARGMHDAVVDVAKRRWLDVHHSLDRPPCVTLRSLDDGRPLATIHDCASDPRVAELGLVPPALTTVTSRDGVTLHVAVYAPSPASTSGRAPHPAIVSVYGGPHVQRVSNGWDVTVDLRAQYLRQLGYVVLVVDNRGSARRGLAFEGAVRHAMGGVEVRDQEDAVRALAARGLVDPKRVGVYGWSYGGYMSLMCLARAPETFRAAVSGAPVTNWDGYDTHYTERYMGTPQDNADGYRVSSVMHHVPNQRGTLLLVHGLLDENVHFRHTARLVNALNRARKPYELLMYPDERHMPRAEKDRVHMEERIRDFFVRELAPARD
jgi:dipeptidyl-peptidase-4